MHIFFDNQYAIKYQQTETVSEWPMMCWCAIKKLVARWIFHVLSNPNLWMHWCIYIEMQQHSADTCTKHF